MISLLIERMGLYLLGSRSGFLYLSSARCPLLILALGPLRHAQHSSTDGAHHGLDGVVVAHVTECNNLLTRLAWVLMCHACVGVDSRGTGDMGTGQDGHAVVFFAKTEEESACALKVGVPEGCDGETESGGEGLSQVGDFV